MYCSNSVSAKNRASAMAQYVEARRKAAQRRSGKRPLSADGTAAEDGKRRKHEDGPKTSDDARRSRVDFSRSAAVAKDDRSAADRAARSADAKKSVCDQNAGNALSTKIKMVGRKATFTWWPVVKSGPQAAVADIKRYELFLCKVDRKKMTKILMWKVKGDVETLRHPMECQFRFARGFAYYCIVRAVDAHDRRGRFAFRCATVH